MPFSETTGNTQSANNKKLLYFFLSLVGLIVGWELLYHLALKPGRVVDAPLTNLVTAISVWTINLLHISEQTVTWLAQPASVSDVLYLNQTPVFIIADQCNALDLMAIYLGMLLLLPSTLKRKITFAIGGIAVIIMANVIRCVALYWLYMHHRSYFDFNHHYTFTILLYLLIFVGWLWFIKPMLKNETDR